MVGGIRLAQLECRKLCLGYDSKVIVNDLNFSVDAGDYLCIVGENGSGKSTLMRTILGLQSAISGKVIRGDGVLKNDIGYLPQQTVVQRDFPASVGEIVLSGFQGKCGLRPFYKKEEKELAREKLSKMGIAELEKKCYRELSGGQQQRVLLARALCATKKILLLDEPAAGLDPKVTAEMYELINSLNKDDGITIIMITHDISQAMCYASHILHIGKENFFGSKEDYLNSKFGKIFNADEVGKKEEEQKGV